jgi:hypothetical protein
MARRNDGGADDPIVVAIDSFHLGDSTIIEGNPYRSSHPAVRECPERFIDWYSTTGERGPGSPRAHGRRARTGRAPVGMEDDGN